MKKPVTPPYLLQSTYSGQVAFPLFRPEYEPNNGATPWYAEVGLGTPAQHPLRFMVDTGTKNTWITSTLCTSEACAPHRKFNPKLSGSYRLAGNPQQISFGAWGAMEVQPSADLIHLPGLQDPSEVTFFMSTNYSGTQFQELICDGGIGIPAHLIPGNESTEILNMLKARGQIQWAIASFWYDPENHCGEACFGAVDPAKFKPETVNILPLKDFPQDLECWIVNLECMNGLFPDGSVQDILQATDVAFALDTGSSRFKGDHKYIQAAIDGITRNGKYPSRIVSPQSVGDFPYPTLELVLGGRKYQVPPERYFIQVSETEWELAFHDMADMDNEFLVGTTFLEGLYTVFDFDHRCVILAEPKFPSSGEKTEEEEVASVPAPSPTLSQGITNRWLNSYGSLMTLYEDPQTGWISGTYSSTTGGTGTYLVVGCAPRIVPEEGAGSPLALSILWRSNDGGQSDPSHEVSGMAGQLVQGKNGPQLVLEHAFVETHPATTPALGTYLDKLTFLPAAKKLPPAAASAPGTATGPDELSGAWSGMLEGLPFEVVLQAGGTDGTELSGSCRWGDRTASPLRGFTDSYARSGGLTRQGVTFCTMPENLADGSCFVFAGYLNLTTATLHLSRLQVSSTPEDSLWYQTSILQTTLQRTR